MVVFFWSCGRLLGVVWAESGVIWRAVSYRSRLDLRAWGLYTALLLFWGSLGSCWPPRVSSRSALVGGHLVRNARFRHHGGQEQRISPPNPPSEPRLGHQSGHEKKNAEAATRATRATSTRQIKKHEGNRATRDDQGAQGATTRKAPRRRLEAHRGPREPTAGCRRPTGSTRGELARPAVWATQAASRAPPRFPPSRGSRGLIS